MEKFLSKTRHENFYFKHLSGFVTPSGEVFITDPLKSTFKRAMDIMLGLGFTLFVLWWLFPIIALGIKLSSSGPVLYVQKRHGKDNTVFNCYKFRTMRHNKQSVFRQAVSNDPRVTRFGKFLRKTSLDELPQLFNVLKGDMSIVGPRPHAVPMNDHFSSEILNYQFRHNVKPGITGLAQAKGYRGEIKHFYDIYHRVRFDHFYIKKWCFMLDLKILVWTFNILVKRSDKAY